MENICRLHVCMKIVFCHENMFTDPFGYNGLFRVYSLQRERANWTVG
jgi:hypothetical protein